LVGVARVSDEEHDAEASGGDVACWAHLLCSVCGEMLDGELHAHEVEPEE
jgi:hypothetical protein